MTPGKLITRIWGKQKTNLLKTVQRLIVLFEITLPSQQTSQTNKKVLGFQRHFRPWKILLCAKVDQMLWNAEQKTLVGAVHQELRGVEILSMKILLCPNHYYTGTLMIEVTVTQSINHCLHENNPVWVSCTAKNGCCWAARCRHYTSGIQISRLHVDVLVTLNRCLCICQHTPIGFWWNNNQSTSPGSFRRWTIKPWHVAMFAHA